MRTIQGELNKWRGKNSTKVTLPKVKKKDIQDLQKTDEKLSRREWEELMGQNRSRYYRGPGGAYRSK
ncbi:hypothetical protein ACSVDA_10865 [Cytobacillus sp. Hm23]